MSARGRKTRDKVDAYVVHQAHDLGRRAFREQRPPGANPYAATTDEGLAWKAGYEAEAAKALRGEKP